MKLLAFDAVVEHGVAFANSLFLFGRSNQRPDPRWIVLSDARSNMSRHEANRFATYKRSELVEGGKPFDPVDQDGFVLVIELSDLLGAYLFDGEVKLAMENVDGSTAIGKMHIKRLGDAHQDAVDPLNLLNIAASLDLLDVRLVRLFDAGVSGQAQFTLKHAIDVAGRSNTGFVVEGWIENARLKQLSCMSSDGLTFIAGSEAIYKTRPDVSEHLRAEKQPVLTDDHGFLLNFPFSRSGADSLLLMQDDSDGLTPLGVIGLQFSSERDRLLQVVSSATGGRLPHPVQAKKLFLPFFVQNRRANEYSVNWIRKYAHTPKTSIIVPMFKEYRFLFSLLTMQKNFNTDYEWIFVSDDPTQHHILSQILEKRSGAIGCSTALVLNRFNYGYGESNNIGAAVARGSNLLFMNSDIWIDSSLPISNAVRVLATGQYQIIGFRLLYEDGTLQHDGMNFSRSGILHDLLIVDHPRKGTPPDEEADQIIEVPAVTGALLLIAKELFLKIGQFDLAYIKGDFEDADLCMKVWEGRGRVGLYKTSGIYHLERQSIRLMDSDAGRMALTYLNCITFNERWAKHILDKRSSHTVAQRKSAKVRQEKLEA